MNKEIEIPDGYEARIEGNKVIIELKESEDERIRKILIHYFSDDDTTNGISNSSIRAWLEKQKEQKLIDIDFVSDWLKKHIKIYINSEYNEFHKTVEHDGSINIERLIEDLKKAIEQQPFAREFMSKPIEWSEVEQNVIDCAVDVLEKELPSLAASLKSLRPHPHWKPSEEQMQALCRAYLGAKDSERKLLESLHDDLKKL